MDLVGMMSVGERALDLLFDLGVDPRSIGEWQGVLDEAHGYLLTGGSREREIQERVVLMLERLVELAEHRHQRR